MDWKLKFYPIYHIGYIRFALPLMVTKLFPGKKIKDFLRASSAIVGKGTDLKLRALPFLHLDSFALYAALSARLVFFAVCYRAIVCFLPFKTKVSSRVNTVKKTLLLFFSLTHRPGIK